MTLPLEKSKDAALDPRLFLLYGAPKVGKSTIVNELPSNLILDFETGTKYLNSISISIIGLTPPNGEDPTEITERHADARYYLQEAGQEIMNNGRPYNFITVDTASELEVMVKTRALEMYLATPMGKDFDGDDVLELDRGSGYYYLRKAFVETINKIRKLSDRVILIAHLKETILDKKGVEVSSKDIDLTGKIKNITCAAADAIGYMYRNSNSDLMINFKSSDAIICGSRCDHLRGKDIRIAEYDNENNELVNVNWDLVYPDIFKELNS